MIDDEFDRFDDSLLNQEVRPRHPMTELIDIREPMAELKLDRAVCFQSNMPCVRVHQLTEPHYRKPRSKKKRLLKKWRNNLANHRNVNRNFFVPNHFAWYVTPETFEELRKEGIV